MNIKISNNPENERIERVFKFVALETDLQTKAVLKGFVYQTIEKETKEGIVKVTPLGMNPNGQYIELIADNSTFVNQETGEYLTVEEIEQEEEIKQNKEVELKIQKIGEFDYIKNMLIVVIPQFLGKAIEETNVLDIMTTLVNISVDKQDRKQRFDK